MSATRTNGILKGASTPKTNSDSDNEPEHMTGAHLLMSPHSKTEPAVIKSVIPAMIKTFKIIPEVAEAKKDGTRSESEVTFRAVCNKLHELPDDDDPTTIWIKEAAHAIVGTESKYLNMTLDVVSSQGHQVAMKKIELDAKSEALGLNLKRPASGGSAGPRRLRMKNETEIIHPSDDEEEVKEVAAPAAATATTTTQNRVESSKEFEVTTKPSDSNDQAHRLEYHLWGIDVTPENEPVVDVIFKIFKDQIETSLEEAQMKDVDITQIQPESRRNVWIKRRNKVIAKTFSEDGNSPALAKLYKGRPGNMKASRSQPHNAQPCSFVKLEVISRITSYLQLHYDIFEPEWFDVVGHDTKFTAALLKWASKVSTHKHQRARSP